MNLLETSRKKNVHKNWSSRAKLEWQKMIPKIIAVQKEEEEKKNRSGKRNISGMIPPAE